MGVAGSGKTTIGQLLSQELGWPFYEGDEYHPASNIEKMQELTALTDADREPWLSALGRLIADLTERRQSAVIACSALKHEYRNVLVGGSRDVLFAYLKVEFDLVRQRLLGRKGHFMKAGLLRSQFDALEEPADAVVLDGSAAPETIVREIRIALEL